MKPTPLLILLAICAPLAHAQTTELILDDPTAIPETAWAEPEPAGAPIPDAGPLGQAARLLAGGDPERAKPILDDWIGAHKRTDHPLLGKAYALRGDALLAMDREYSALFDYEVVCRDFPGGTEFAHAVQREYEIGKAYLDGLRRRFLGVRLETGKPTGEELLIRVQERLPGSALAEQAAIDLADYYYDERKMELAAEMYDIFLYNYPDSIHREKAMLRRIYCNVARFKGPRYDAAGLVEARLLIDDFRSTYPADAEAAGITEGLVTRIDESEALQMLDTARWYLKQNDQPSARFTLKRLLRKHPESAAAADGARLMIAQGWLREPTPAEGAPTAPEPVATQPTDGPGMAELRQRLLKEPPKQVDDQTPEPTRDRVLDDIFAVPPADDAQDAAP